jgi:hypothetical protein
MIIVSQDGEMIINFNSMFKIEVFDKEIIVGVPSSRGEFTCETLGKYETKERAKEVLEEIIEYYSLRNLGEMDYMSAIAYIQARRTSAFYMPAE